MMETGYNQFCPVAMASEILCPRWTIILLRELVSGSTRFNDLRRGVPKMSSALLSKRLKELEAAGIVTRVSSKTKRSTHEYHLTEAGQDLKGIINAFGIWGQRWVETEITLDNLDPSLLMWDMRRCLNTSPLPSQRSVIEFTYTCRPQAEKNWWLIVEPNGHVDLCSVDPGFDITLYITTTLRIMTSIWMGISTVKSEQAATTLILDGDLDIIRKMDIWLGLSPFASETKKV